MKNIILIFLLLGFFKDSKSSIIQDPARTSDNARVNPDKNLNGSSGRYKKNHKHANGKKFATNKKHIKTAKSGRDNAKEKSKHKGDEKGG